MIEFIYLNIVQINSKFFHKSTHHFNFSKFRKFQQTSVYFFINQHIKIKFQKFHFCKLCSRLAISNLEIFPSSNFYSTISTAKLRRFST